MKLQVQEDLVATGLDFLNDAYKAAVIGLALSTVGATVMAIAALNFNGLLQDYDMSAFLYHPLNKTLGVQIKSLTDDMGNPNGLALTFVYAVLMMIISAVVLYFVYGRGGRDNMKD